MNKTKIEWCDCTINPVKGLCPVGCSYCYARRLYKRFKWDPRISFDPTVFLTLPRKPSRVFVGSTIELFNEWVDSRWMRDIFSIIRNGYPHHTFIFLTKQPQNLPVEWPDNCWVGVSVTDRYSMTRVDPLCHVQATVKFISFEPLLGQIPLGIYTVSVPWGGGWEKGGRDYSPLLNHIDWLIIGQQTPSSKKTAPKVSWIREIVDAGDRAGIKVFLKDNLKPLLCNEAWNDKRLVLDWTHGESEFEGIVDCTLRQEIPSGSRD